MNINKKLQTVLAGAVVLAATYAYASTGGSGDEFAEFQQTVHDWTQGSLGIGLATTMLLLGGAIGVAKNSPMPALSGIAGAAFFNWGPGIIEKIMGSGALM